MKIKLKSTEEWELCYANNYRSTIQFSLTFLEVSQAI